MSIADLVAQAEAASPYHPDGRIKSLWESLSSSKAAHRPLNRKDVEDMLQESGYKGPIPIEYTRTGKPSVLMYSKADDAQGTEKRKSFVAVSELESKSGVYVVKVVKAECTDPVAFQSCLKSYSAYARNCAFVSRIGTAIGSGVGMLTGLAILKAAGGFDTNSSSTIAEVVTKIGPPAVLGFVGGLVGSAVGGYLFGRLSYERIFGEENPVSGINAIKSVIDAGKAPPQRAIVWRRG